MPDNAFYDLNITSGSLAGLTVAQFAQGLETSGSVLAEYEFVESTSHQ